jgi:hypothetical protein
MQNWNGKFFAFVSRFFTLVRMCLPHRRTQTEYFLIIERNNLRCAAAEVFARSHCSKQQKERDCARFAGSQYLSAAAAEIKQKETRKQRLGRLFMARDMMING